MIRVTYVKLQLWRSELYQSFNTTKCILQLALTIKKHSSRRYLITSKISHILKWENLLWIHRANCLNL